MNKKSSTVDKIKFVIEKVRPYILGDGGDIEFVKYDKDSGIVYVRLLGNCVNCSSADYTIKDMVEELLTAEIPEILSVEQVL